METSNNNTFIECQKFPPFPVCSGNGVCDTAKGVCICNEGWSSIGDFASKDGVDCNINIAAVKIMYLLMMALGIIAFMNSSNHIVRQMYYYRKKEGKMKGYLSDAARVYPFWVLMMGTFSMVAGIYRYIHPLRVIGNDITITILGCFVGSGYLLSVSDFMVMVIRFFYHYTLMMPDAANARMRKEVSIVLSLSYIFKSSAILISAIPILCLIFQDHQFEVGAAYHGLTNTWNIVAAIFVSIRGIHVMIKLLEEHAKNVDISIGSMNNKLQLLLLRLKSARCIFSTLVAGPTIAWYIIAFSRTFSRQATYFVAYIIMCGLTVSIPAIALVSPHKLNKSKKASPEWALSEDRKPQNIPNVNISVPQSSYGGESSRQQNSNVILPQVV